MVATQPATSTTSTDSSGAYTLSLASGTYNVMFSAAGYNSNFDGSINAPTGGSATASVGLYPVPAGFAQDLFSRPDQTGFGTASDGHAWSNDFNVYPTAKTSISNRQAFVQTATQFTDHDAWMGIPYRDQEVAVDMNMVNVVQDPSFQHGGRVLARVQHSDSWIVLTLNPSNSTMAIWVDDAGSWTQIGGITMSFSTNVWYHAKIDVIANTVLGKAWLFGTSEPGWQVSGTQSVISVPGVGGLRCGAADVYFANFSESPITQVSGTVTNASTGAGVAGATVSLSNGATTTTDSGGNYVFGALAAGTYTVSASRAGYNGASVSANVSIGMSAVGTNISLAPIGAPPPTPGASPSPTGH